MVIMKTRLGIGCDIEHNEDILHIVETRDGEEQALVAFQGLIVKLPFLSIYVGDFAEVE